MSGREAPPDWRLPAGVNASLWRYAHSRSIAEQEDDYFQGHPLFAADREAVRARFKGPGRLVDLGCGAGRMALDLAGAGFEVVGVDLSRPLLEVVKRKAEAAGLNVGCVQANLCRLGCFPDSSFTHAVSLFSTLGMVRGPAARAAALRETARVLERGGKLAIHVHNIWINARTREGVSWMAWQWLKRWRGDADAGDRRMTYRGIAGMEVHLYRWAELLRAIRAAGFKIEEVLPIDTVTAKPIRWARLLPGLRAGGWIVFATKR